MTARERTADAPVAPYRQPVEVVLSALGVDGRTGLTAGEARARLARHGPNELRAEAKAPAWKRFLAQFRDVLVILLLVATAISATHRRRAPGAAPRLHEGRPRRPPRALPVGAGR